MTRIAAGVRSELHARPTANHWRGVIYHGEVFGFLAAWIVGVIVALTSQPEKMRDNGSREMAATAMPVAQQRQ